MRAKIRQALILTVICSAALILVLLSGLVEGIELKSLDWRFRLNENPAAADSSVVLIAIDEASLQAFKENGIVWKWPRDIYAILVDYLRRGGARVIVFDILFNDADIDRLSSDAEETDGSFAAAMRQAGTVILAAHLRQESDFLSWENAVTSQPITSAVEPEQAHLFFESYSHAVLPLPLFQKSAAATGAANYRDDPHDGICRRVDLFFDFGGRLFPHLGIAAFLLDREVSSIRVEPGKRIYFDDLAVPIDRQQRFLINWYGKGGPDGAFRYFSIGPLITSAIALEHGREPLVPAERFADKVVIIGANAPGLFDFQDTPFTRNEPYPAMEIYATLISNLRQGDFLHRLDCFWGACAVVLLIAAVCFAFSLLIRLRTVILFGVVLAFGWSVLAFILFQKAHLWIDWIAPQIAIFLSFTAAAVVSYQTEGKARRRLRSLFGRYLSPVVISEVVEKSQTLELGGRELDTTIFFSDIKSFSSISETLSPPQLVSWLNDYFTVATDIILRYDGLLDKYIGDAIMALFGAPLPKDNHAVLACYAALDIQKAIREHFSDSDGKVRFETRIGLNSGKVVVGNIGSSLRFDYTAIGDDVNLASRLEGVNKVFSTAILISEFTRNQLDDTLVCRELDVLRVKGKQNAVRVYELVGRRTEIDSERLDLIHEFENGIELYRKQDFKQARQVFEKLLTNRPNDGACREYLERCKSFMANPPQVEWDGVFIMKTK